MGEQASAVDAVDIETHLPVTERAVSALDRLKRVCQRFVDLEHQVHSSPIELLHATAASLHTFAASIDACEAAGLGRDEVMPYLQDVRAMHGRSPFVARLQTWPRGYPGDFETVEWLCDAHNQAPAGTVPWAIEEYALQSPVAQQHRNKVGLQARAILSTITADRRAHIASIGCGGCRDLSLVQHYIRPGHGRFVLVDADPGALDFARHRLDRLADRCEFVEGRVPRILSTIAMRHRFDLVVAGGLFDYLPDRWAVSTLRGIRQMLAPGGRVLFSNIRAGNPFRPWLEYLAEWRLIERGEADLQALLREAEFGGRTHVSLDSSQLAFMVEAQHQ